MNEQKPKLGDISFAIRTYDGMHDAERIEMIFDGEEWVQARSDEYLEIQRRIRMLRGEPGIHK